MRRNPSHRIYNARWKQTARQLEQDAARERVREALARERPDGADQEARSRELAETFRNGNRKDCAQECAKNPALAVRVARRLSREDVGVLLVLLDIYADRAHEDAQP